MTEEKKTVEIEETTEKTTTEPEQGKIKATASKVWKKVKYPLAGAAVFAMGALGILKAIEMFEKDHAAEPDVEPESSDDEPPFDESKKVDA